MVFSYAIACLAAFLLVVLYCGLFKKKDVWFLLTFVSIFICSSGYFALAASRSLDEALLANRIAYLGSVFLPFFLLMTIMKVCKCSFPKYMPFAMTVINIAVLAITLSSGYSDIYYKSASFQLVGGAGTLIKEYGSLHLSYYIYLIAYFAAMIWVITRAFFKKKVVSYKHALYLAIAVFINISLYFVEKLAHIEVELLPFSYIITEVFLLFIYKKLEDYDIERIMQSSLATDSTGVILFDAGRNYKGCNEDAAVILPELNELQLEYPIPDTASTLCTTVLPLLTGSALSDSTIYRHGGKIYRIVAKPIHRRDGSQGRLLGMAVVVSDDTAQQEYVQLISDYNKKLEDEVAKKTEHVLAMHDNLILSMANMVEGRDPNTGGHIKRTSSVVSIFVRKLEAVGYDSFTPEFLKNVAKAAPMHDLGKIAIEDAILRKPGKYTPEEYAIMQTHAAKGADIVSRILQRDDDEQFYDIAVNVAHYHHEKYDGTGYPEGLRGRQIPIEARIMALADVFDALVSKRCYKEEYSFDEAFQIIRDSLGQHFDPELGEIFLGCEDELIATYSAH